MYEWVLNPKWMSNDINRKSADKNVIICDIRCDYHIMKPKPGLRLNSFSWCLRISLTKHKQNIFEEIFFSTFSRALLQLFHLKVIEKKWMKKWRKRHTASFSWHDWLDPNSTEWTFHNCLFRDRLKNWYNCVCMRIKLCAQNHASHLYSHSRWYFQIQIEFIIPAILLNKFFSTFSFACRSLWCMQLENMWVCLWQMLSRHGWFACVCLFHFFIIVEWIYHVPGTAQFFN